MYIPPYPKGYLIEIWWLWKPLRTVSSSCGMLRLFELCDMFSYSAGRRWVHCVLNLLLELIFDHIFVQLWYWWPIFYCTFFFPSCKWSTHSNMWLWIHRLCKTNSKSRLLGRPHARTEKLCKLSLKWHTSRVSASSQLGALMFVSL